jgi:hypothetical protein
MIKSPNSSKRMKNAAFLLVREMTIKISKFILMEFGVLMMILMKMINQVTVALSLLAHSTKAFY